MNAERVVDLSFGLIYVLVAAIATAVLLANPQVFPAAMACGFCIGVTLEHGARGIVRAARR